VHNSQDPRLESEAREVARFNSIYLLVPAYRHHHSRRLGTDRLIGRSKAEYASSAERRWSVTVVTGQWVVDLSDPQFSERTC